MKYNLLLLLIFNISILNAKKEPVKVFLIIEDINKTPESIKEMIDFLYMESKSKFPEFSVIHYSFKDHLQDEWGKKKKVLYKPFNLKCDFNSCSQFSNLVLLDGAEKIKLYTNSDELLNCQENNQNIKKQQFNGTESAIGTILNKEYLENRKSKQSLSVYIYISASENYNKPSISFQDSIVDIYKGDPLVLTPKSSGVEPLVYNWKNIGKDCFDCKTVEVYPTKYITYSVNVSDNFGCESNNANISVRVKEKCFNGTDPVKLCLGTIETEKYKYFGSGVFAADWQILSNSAGGYIFDLVTTQNCAAKYKLSLLDLEGSIIMQQDFIRESVDYRSMNPYFDSYPNHLVFRLDLRAYSRILDRSALKVRIESYNDLREDDESGIVNSTFGIYDSPSIKFTKCN
jgi:hypothetical protein